MAAGDLVLLKLHDAVRTTQSILLGPDPIDCALDLMRRLPPQHVSSNLAKLLQLAPDLAEDLVSAIDQPLKVAKDASTGRDYLLCDYNRDGDSHRSEPDASTWSILPGIADLRVFDAFSGLLDHPGPTNTTRRWPMAPNHLHNSGEWKSLPMPRLTRTVNCKLRDCRPAETLELLADPETGICRYFEGGVSSVYMWDLPDGFAAVILIKKCVF
jgi:capping protein beta